MAAHAPRGAENDLPQARPVRIFLIFFEFFAGTVPTLACSMNFVVTWVLTLLVIFFDV